MIKSHSLLFLTSILFFSPTISADICLPDDSPGKTCTAKDFTLTEQLVSGPPSCVEGEIIPGDITLHLGMEPTANERYDIGIFAGNSGQPPIGGSSCTFTSLTPQTVMPSMADLINGSGPFRDIDGNACGDTLKADGEIIRNITLSNVLCKDSNNDGNLDIPYAITWKSSIAQCTDPTDPNQFFPEQSSKCINWVGDVDIIVIPPQPSIDVDKTAVPNIINSGDLVTYHVSVLNSGHPSITLTSLLDDKFGDLNGQGSCILPAVISVGDNYSCSFTKIINGVARATHLNTVTASATDGGTPVEDSDSALVIIIDSNDAGIGQLVWEDLNADGFWQLGESGIDGVTLSLKNDIGATIQTTVTDFEGEYEFDGLAAGDYQVVVTDTAGKLNGMVLTAGVEPHDVTLSTGQLYLEANFGYARAAINVVKQADPTVIHAPSGLVTYSISVKNTGPLDVTLVELVDSKFFELNGQGNCATPQALPVGSTYNCTFSKTITGNAGDTHENTVVAVVRDQDGHFLHDADNETVSIIDGDDASIGNLVWLDSNRNGVQDNGEPGIDNVTLQLRRSTNSDGNYDVIVGSETTINSGAYDFIDLAAADYQVVVTDLNDVLAGLILTGGIEPHEVTLASAEIYTDADFGYAPPLLPAIIVEKNASPLVIHAPSADVSYTISVENTGETDVSLLNLIDSLFGDLNGQGDCSVPQTILIGNSYSCSFIKNISGPAFSFHTNVVGATAKDSDNNSAHGTNSARVFIIPAGGIINGTIGDLVWNDLNGNGVVDPGEPGIANVTLELLLDASVTATTTTATDGAYLFSGLPIGSYQVIVTDDLNILAGFTLTGGANPLNVALSINENYLDADFGYHRATPFAKIPTFSIWGLLLLAGLLALLALIQINRKHAKY